MTDGLELTEWTGRERGGAWQSGRPTCMGGSGACAWGSGRALRLRCCAFLRVDQALRLRCRTSQDQDHDRGRTSSMAFFSELKAGTLFGGDYVIVEPLSEGGMGAVYVAEQRSTGSRRAL